MMPEPGVDFGLARVVLTTLLTLCLMSVLTEFKYGIRRILLILCGYLCYVGLSSWLIIELFGYFEFCKVFIFTISIPATLLVYLLAMAPVAFGTTFVLLGTYLAHYSTNGWRIIYLYAVVLVMAVVYFVIFLALRRSARLQESKHEQQLLAM